MNVENFNNVSVVVCMYAMIVPAVVRIFAEHGSLQFAATAFLCVSLESLSHVKGEHHNLVSRLKNFLFSCSSEFSLYFQSDISNIFNL